MKYSSRWTKESLQRHHSHRSLGRPSVTSAQRLSLWPGSRSPEGPEGNTEVGRDLETASFVSLKIHGASLCGLSSELI